MERLSALRAFTTAARLGSFAEAARALSLSRDQVSKLIAALETELRTPLFTRSTRSLRLTGAGELLLARTEGLVGELESAFHAVGGLNEGPRGPLRVNAPMSLGQSHVAPLLPSFHACYPEVRLRLELDDRFVDPARSGADLTLRVSTQAPPPDCVARPLALAPRWLVASPAYLRQQGRPKSVEDLAGHAALHYGEQHGGSWTLAHADGAQTVMLRGPLCSNNGDVLAQAAEAGMGITLLPAFLVGQRVIEKRLSRVLPAWSCGAPLTVQALYTAANRQLPALRAFLAHLAEQLPRLPGLEAPATP